MNPKAILFDLDDTLTESKQKVNDEMAQIFSKLLENNKAAIVSGAKFEQQLNQFINFLPKDSKYENLFSFPQNAAECRTFDGNLWVEQYSFLLSDEEVIEITGALNKVLEETKILEHEVFYGECIENRGAQITFSALGQDAPVSAKKTWDPNQEKRKDIQKRLMEIIPQYEIVIGGMTSVDITKKGINKTNAVTWISEKFSLPVSEMLYVGDSLFPGGNDAIVIQTGIPTIETKNPEQTIEIIKSFI
jgi:HAD superfamily hydrolase (TIGR01484 family)